MAYELFVATGWRAPQRDFIAVIGFDELPAFSRLIKRGDFDFLERITNLFEDQEFSLDQVNQALDSLLPLMHVMLHPDERLLLHKLIAVLSFASRRQLGLYGIAD